MATLYEILNDTPNLNVTISGNQLIEALDYAVSLKLKELQPVTEEKQEEKLYTSAEACELLRCSKPTLYRWKKEKIIPHVRIGSNIRYKESDIQKLLNSKKR